MDKEMVRQILHVQLNVRKVCAKKMVPKTSLGNKKTAGKTVALTWNESQNKQMCMKMTSL
jgi:hypothetical protein